MPTPLDILKQYWGYESFRHLQDEIIDSVIAGNDVMALLPTGGGKSICFQVPGVALNGITIVVSPLIALMKDQVEQLTRRHIKATAIYSGLTAREIDIILDNCAYGDFKFLYVSPERLKSDLFRKRVEKMDVSLLAIDEAHCISLWGYDFRPPYLEIPEFRNLLPDVPVIALTATATKQVQEDIAQKLELRNPQFFAKSFARENISYSVRKTLDKKGKLLEIVSKIPGCAIVYVNSRKETREIAQYLMKNKISADFYHAGLSTEIRGRKQEAWIRDQVRVIVATNAFGMGIDKPDVRLVVHLEVPQSPESYYQEAGRGGRDGQKSYSVILYHNHDVDNLQRMVRQSNPEVDYLKRIYQALANFLKVAVGSSENASYDFEIGAFCDHFKFEPREAYLGIKKLESEGLIHLNESFNNPSRAWILVERADLYKFQIANSSFDPLIKALLRLYGGELFNQLTNVSEVSISRLLGTDPAAVRKGLEGLDKMGILDYDKQKEKPQMVFLSERYDSQNLPLDTKRIRERMEHELSKVKAIVDYVENDQRCRSQILLDYFGEVSYQNCGICDTCLKQQEHDEDVHHEQHQVQIIHILKEGPKYMEELISEIEPENEDEFQILVREMIDQGKVKYNEQWQLELDDARR